MVSNAITAGVKKASKNEPKTAKHSQEQLEKLLDEAQGGEISNGEGPSAGEKVSAAPGAGDGRQSADREQPYQSNSSQNGDNSGNPHSETQPADDSQSSDVNMWDVEPEIANKSASAGPAGARTRGLNDSTNDTQLLVDFQQMTISDQRHSKKKRHEDPQPGDVEAFGGQSKNRFFIFRVGPIQVPSTCIEGQMRIAQRDSRICQWPTIGSPSSDTKPKTGINTGNIQKTILPGLEASPLMKRGTASGAHMHGSKLNGWISKKSTRPC